MKKNYEIDGVSVKISTDGDEIEIFVDGDASVMINGIDHYDEDIDIESNILKERVDALEDMIMDILSNQERY